MFCPNCGRNLDNGAKFCDGCGASLLEHTTLGRTTSIKEEYPQSSGYIPQGPQNYTPPQAQQEYYQPTSFNQKPQAGNSEVLSIGNYIVMMLLAGIPIVGFILLLVWSFSASANQNKKNWARATLIMGLVVGVLCILFSSILASIFASLL